MVTQGKAIDFKSIVFDESLGEGEYGHIYGGRIIEDENATVFKECSIKMLKGKPRQRAPFLSSLGLPHCVNPPPWKEEGATHSV